MARLKSFLDQVNDGTWSQDQTHTKTEALLKAFEGAIQKEDEEDDLPPFWPRTTWTSASSTYSRTATWTGRGS